MRIQKAIIAAAGFGTRFLPATKVIPKETLPLIDRPIIQYLVEEAANSGLKEVILIVRPGASAIKDHFSPKVAVEAHLRRQGKKELLEQLKQISKMAKISVVEQDPKLPYGTGAPLVTVEGKVKKNEFFVFMFGDDLVKAKVPATKQLIDLWQKKQAVILGCQEVPRSQVCRYGIIRYKKGSKEEVEEMVEKPKVDEAPSCLASFGRFILNREIVDILLEQQKQVATGKEFYLTEAITTYAQKKPVLAQKIDGQWLTTGDPLNWLKATLEFALDRPDLGPELAAFLKTKHF